MPRPKNNLDMAQGAYLGVTLGATLSLFAYAGYRIDRWLDSSPIGLVAGCLLGLAAGMTYVIRRVAAMQSGGKDGDESR
jgi:F0F1-type ATP synthase assembly protein I